MKVKSVFLALLILFCVLSVQAEEQKKSSEVTTQTATTSDGRKVILKSDGTWEYYKEETPPAPKPAPVTAAVPAAPVKPAQEVPIEKPPAPSASVQKQIPNATLSFVASVNAKPIAAETFYLLDNDLGNILQSSNFKSQKGMSLLNTFSMVYYGSSLGIQKSVKAFDSAMQSIKPHIVATTITDPNGKGQFPSMAPGTYYLMNLSIIFLNTGSLSDRKAILWNTRIQVQPGENSVTLDEKNALL